MDYEEIEILFVEDTMEDAMLTIRALSKSGLTNKLYHVKDGAEALNFIYCRGTFESRNISQRPKMILLDLKMPKISGMQVLETIKTDHEMKDIPIVVLTSSKEDPDIKKCYELGANSYIVKPVVSDNFFRAVQDLGLYWMLLNQPPV